MFLNFGAAVEPPVTYSEIGEPSAPHKITDPTIGPSLVSINPVNDVLKRLSEYPIPSRYVRLVPV